MPALNAAACILPVFQKQASVSKYDRPAQQETGLEEGYENG